MGTYWSNFMEEYKDRLVFVSTARTLEAFWHYCNTGQKDKSQIKCDNIMNDR